ncbi:MAG: hypothetical protein ACXWL9_01065 [Syntrophales bacterium]
MRAEISSQKPERKRVIGGEVSARMKLILRGTPELLLKKRERAGISPPKL